MTPWLLPLDSNQPSPVNNRQPSPRWLDRNKMVDLGRIELPGQRSCKDHPLTQSEARIRDQRPVTSGQKQPRAGSANGAFWSLITGHWSLNLVLGACNDQASSALQA